MNDLIEKPIIAYSQKRKLLSTATRLFQIFHHNKWIDIYAGDNGDADLSNIPNPSGKRIRFYNQVDDTLIDVISFKS